MRLISLGRLSFAALVLALCSLSCGAGGAKEGYLVSPVPTDWEIIGPGGGGSTFIPVFHPTEPDRIIIRCDMTGSYLSRDKGESWQMLNFPGGVGCFAFDARNPDDIYVGGKGLYRSRDNGESWTLLFPAQSSVRAAEHEGDHADFRLSSSDNYPGGTVVSVLADPDLTGQLYCAINTRRGGSAEAGLFVSRDDGGSWSEAASFESRILALFIDPADTDRVIVFCGGSYNTWDKNSKEVTTRNHSGEMSSLVSVSAGVDPENPGLFRLWAVSAPGLLGGNLPGRVFVSEDAAMTWMEATENIIQGNPVAEDAPAPSFKWIACSQGDSRSAYLVCSQFMQKDEDGKTNFWYGIFRTSDAGKNWRWVYKAGGGSGRYGVRDGREAENLEDSWVRDAFSGDFILAICTAVSPADPEQAIFTDWYRSMKTEDGGATWTALYARNLPDSSVASRGQDVTTCYGVHFDPFDPQHIAISYTDIGCFHTFNRGKSWYRAVNGVPRAWENTCYWMEFDPEVRGRVWSAWSSWHDIPRFKMIRRTDWRSRAKGGVCVSVDGGRTWEVSSLGLPEGSPTTSLALDPSSPVEARVLYITAYGQGVYKSTDGGVSWVQKNAGLGENFNVWQVRLVDSRTLYLVVTPALIFGDEHNELVDGELYRSDDAGESWNKVTLPDGVRFPNNLEFDPSQTERLYLSCWSDLSTGDYGGKSGPDGREEVECQGGVLLSEDGGRSWTQVFDPETYVYSVTVDPARPGRTYAVTFHNGAYRSDNYGKTWGKIDGYNFYWGHRAIPDPQDTDKVFITTFGGSVFHGKPTVGGKM